MKTLNFTDQELFDRIMSDVEKTRRYKTCYKPVNMPTHSYIATSEGTILASYVRFGRSTTAKRCVLSWMNKIGPKSFVREKDLKFYRKFSVISLHEVNERKVINIGYGSNTSS